jgi:O-antigen ligase
VRVQARPIPLAYEEPNNFLLTVYLLFVFCVYLQIGYRWPVLGEIRFEFLLGALLGPVAVITLFRRNVLDVGSVMAWAIALLASMGVMVAFSQVPGDSWTIYVDRALKFAVFGLCIAAFVSSPRSLALFLAVFLLAFMKMGEEGFLGTLDSSMIWENQEVPRLRGSTPSYNHPNSFSGTQLGTLPFLFYLFPLAPWYLRVAILIQALFCGNVILRTGSRTGYVGLIGAMVAMVWMTKKRIRTVVLVLALVLFAGQLIPAEYLGRFESIYEDKSTAGEDTSIGQRKQILLDAIAVFEEHPLGVGVGAFPAVREKLFGRDQDTHNLYLEVATNLGLQGFLIFMGLVIVLWVTLRKLQHDFQSQLVELQCRGPPTKSSDAAEFTRHVGHLKFFLATARATWVFLIIRLVVGMFGMDMYEIYWWFCSGLAIALLSMNRIARARTEKFLDRASAELMSAKAGAPDWRSDTAGTLVRSSRVR